MGTEIALVADLHGNWPATEAVDQDLTARGIDRVFCLGDMVGKGPSPDRTLAWARERCQVALCGNWDEAAVKDTKFQSTRYCREVLGPEGLRYIESLPFEHHMVISGRRLRLVHGRPVVPLYGPDASPQELSSLLEVGGERFDLAGYADCHRAFTRPVEGGMVFNTGSVGNNLGTVGRAYYVILRGTEGEAEAPLEIVHVALPYDVEQAVRDAEAATSLPYAEAFIREIRTGIYSR